jgi:hypothetical protein
MGYHAYGGGSIVYDRELSSEEYNKAWLTLSEAFDTYFREEITKDSKKVSRFDISNDGCRNYDDDFIMQTLDAASRIANIQEGCIEYTGEHDSRWRFIYKNGVWTEENGRTVYESSSGHEIFITISEAKGLLTALVEDPQSGCVTEIKASLFDAQLSFRDKLCSEISSWLSMWRDERMDELKNDCT